MAVLSYHDALPIYAGVGKAHYPIFLVHEDGARRNKPLRRQLLQLLQRGVQTLGAGHGGEAVAVGQGGNGIVGLLHLGSVRARQGGGRKAVGLCGQRGGGEEGEYQKTDSAER